MEVKFGFNLSRIWKHFKDGKFGIVSAYKGDLSKKENEERAGVLKKKVKELGYGYKEIKGKWTGETGVTVEYPLFIPSLSRKDAIVLGKEFEQEAVIFAEKSEEAVLWDTISDKEIMTFKKLETNDPKEDAWQSYSEVKNKKFRYSSVEWYFPFPNSASASSSKWMIGMAEDSYFNQKYSDYDRTKELVEKVKEKLNE